MTSVLIENFPSSTRTIIVEEVDGKARKRFSVGYDPTNKSDDILTGALTSLFLSLLIHDEIFLGLGEYQNVLKAIGPEDTLKLLDRKIIKVVGNNGANVVMQGEKLSLSRLELVKPPMETFEEHLKSLSQVGLREKSLLAQYTENCLVTLPSDAYDVMRADLSNDLTRGTFSQIGLTTCSVADIHRADALKLLRIADAAMALIVQSKLGISSTVQDGFVKEYLNLKLGALTPLAGTDGIRTFSNVARMKGIPDLYTLYKRKTIGMEDILRCRDSVSGGLFRKWYESTDYDEQEVLQRLLKKPDRESKFARFARFVYPEVLGLVNPLLGVAGSAIDSFIVGKIIEGWNPSLFLDEVFKKTVDAHIEVQERSELRQQMIQKFGKVERNSPCPCQSGKKFKHCHGQ